jgi:hypothetical protein
MTIKKFFCQNCGSENDADITPADLTPTAGDWLDCIPPQGFEWRLPAGVITPAYGDPIYISASGEQLSKAQYEHEYGLDPEIALQFMRGRMIQIATTIINNQNRLNQNQSNQKLAKASQVASLNMADDDDWTA